MIGMFAVSGVFLSVTRVSKPLPPGINTSKVIASGRSCLALLNRFSSRFGDRNPIFRI